MLPKSVTPSRVEENFQGAFLMRGVGPTGRADRVLAVFELPQDLFDELEAAATAHPPQRVVNPSKGWGLDWDVYDDYPNGTVPK